MKKIPLWTVIVSLGSAFTVALSAHAASITEVDTTSPTSAPFSIVRGPDGNLWFTEFAANKIGRLTTAGVLTEFASPGDPTGITSGPDGNLWYTEYSANKIARMATTGAAPTEFTVPTAASFPRSIATGSDGNLWFTENSGNKIGKLTTAGVFTEYPTGAGPRGITAGPDGNLWFTEDSNKIGRITTAGVVTEFTVPTAAASPRNIITGSDGALWFTEQVVNKIGRITTLGAFSEFAIPTASSSPSGLVNGPAGTGIWFTEQSGRKIGHISPTGAFLGEVATPSVTGAPEEIALGSDNNLWYTDFNVGKIGKVTLAATDILTITTASPLTAGVVGTAYSLSLAATSGTAPYFFFVKSGTFPPGLLLSYDGKIGGTPTTSGTYAFKVELFDDNMITTTKDFSIVVTDPTPELIGEYTSLKRKNNTLNAKFKVTNTGNKDAASFKVTFYVSKDAVRGGGDAKVVNTTVTGGIAAGASKTISVHFIRSSLKGKYLIGQIDSTSAVNESDETNNDVAKKIS